MPLDKGIGMIYTNRVWSKTFYPGSVFFNTHGLTTSYRCIKTAVFAHLLFPDVFDQTPSTGDENGIFDSGRFMATSKLQIETKRHLMLLMNKFEIVENIRPNWLKNPITGKNLEIDLYMPELNIGIEVQGIQHDRFTPGLHATIDDFEYQQQRDRIKKALCEKNGVMLFEVRSPEEIATFIEDVCKNNPILGFELHKKQTAIAVLPYMAATKII